MKTACANRYQGIESPLLEANFVEHARRKNESDRGLLILYKITRNVALGAIRSLRKSASSPLVYTAALWGGSVPPKALYRASGPAPSLGRTCRMGTAGEAQLFLHAASLHEYLLAAGLASRPLQPALPIACLAHHDLLDALGCHLDPHKLSLQRHAPPAGGHGRQAGQLKRLARVVPANLQWRGRGGGAEPPAAWRSASQLRRPRGGTG